MMLLLAISCSIAAGSVQAQNQMPTVSDALAAMQKGIITKPTPKVIHLNETWEYAALYEMVKDYLVWYKYKGVFYSTLFAEENIQVVTFTPNGEFLNFMEIPYAP